MTDLPSLIAKLEGASGPDQELDARILSALLSTKAIVAVEQSPINGVWCAYEEGYDGRRRIWETPSPFRQMSGPTSSVDAALALIERLDKAFRWRVEWLVSPLLEERPYWASCGLRGEQESGIGATPALALCIACLKALQSSDAQPIGAAATRGSTETRDEQ